MRKIGFASYKNDIKEILPSSYLITQQAHKRKMFIYMLNEFLEPKAQITTINPHYYEQNLRLIFIDKISSFFQGYKLRPERSCKIKKIYTQDTILFQQFFKQLIHPRAQFLASSGEFDSKFRFKNEYEHPVSSLIKLIFNGLEVEMMLDLNKLFTQTVFKRIKASPHAKVSLDSPYIHINEDGKTTRLLPTWKKLNPNALNLHSKQINEGFKQLSSGGIDKCYLLYPKNDAFKQHIILKDKQNHELKVVPYSFSFITREHNKNTKAS